ncbi:hypothetical protein [Rhodobacter sp. NSM]|uniref:hypothetical protein n=1 Tax=Rhodobacter sp. NSM TaxID=3457501 RepID=UPI003FD29D7A
MSRTAASRPPSTAAAFALGAAGSLALFALGLGMTLDRPGTQSISEAEDSATEGPRQPVGSLTYLPLPEPINATIRGNNRQLTLELAFAVEGQRMDLLSMADMLRKDVPLLMVELAQAVLVCDESQPTLEAFRRALPEHLRTVVNERYATADLPDPVFEVMVTFFAVN